MAFGFEYNTLDQFRNTPIPFVRDLEIHCNASFTDNLLYILFWPWYLALNNTLDQFGNKPISSLHDSEIDCKGQNKINKNKLLIKY